MYIVAVIFALIFIVSMIYFFDTRNDQTEVDLKEVHIEEPVAVEKPTVVVESKVVDLAEAKSEAPKKAPRPKSNGPKKAPAKKTTPKK